MPPHIIESLINHIQTLWPCSNVEISLEANPLTCSQDLFQTLKSAGINRISLGVQSFDNRLLAFLGRQHTRATAIQSLKWALKFFDNVSCDLIYGLPNQPLAQWRHTLNEVLHFRPPHISLYQLTIEENTPFYYAFKRNDWRLPSLTEQAKFLRLTWQILAEHGFENYEISNFAQPGKMCTHNKNYWLYGDYIGVGPGAHGRLTLNNIRYQTKCFRHPQTWLNKALNSHSVEVFQALTPQEALHEYVPLALRVKEGVAWERVQSLGKEKHADFINWINIQHLKNLYFLHATDTNISLTEKGRMVADAIAKEILT